MDTTRCIEPITSQMEKPLFVVSCCGMVDAVATMSLVLLDPVPPFGHFANSSARPKWCISSRPVVLTTFFVPSSQSSAESNSSLPQFGHGASVSSAFSYEKKVLAQCGQKTRNADLSLQYGQFDVRMSDIATL